MKNLLFLLVTAITFSSCSLESDECKNSKIEVSKLQSELAAKSSQLDQLAFTVNSVEANLTSIRNTQNAIDSIQKVDNSVDAKTRIQVLLGAITANIEASNNHIQQLEQQLSTIEAKNRTKSKNFEKLIARLRAEVENKNLQIDSLTSTITVLNKSISDKDNAITEKDKIISSKDEQLAQTQAELKAKEATLNTGYFYFGKKADLIAKGIVIKQGGVLGLGKTEVLNGRLDKALFTQVSIKDVAVFDLGSSKKCKVISSHPAESYVLLQEGGSSKLQIKDVAKFWSISKFVVIEVQ